MARARAFSSLFKDIHAPRDLLPELAAERHHNRELVLLTTNWAQLDLALNLVAQLEALGLRHHLLFGDNARLVEHVRRHGPPGAGMVWSSLLERYTQPLGPDPRCPRSCGEGPAETFAMNRASLLPPPNRSAAALACHAAQREYCLPSAATFYRCDSVRRLWLLRHHYTARLLNMRYNVLLLDSDSMVLADPYPLVRRHLQGYTALCLHDITARPFMAVNGGTWYVRGASPEGPVQRLFASAFERALQVLDAYPESEAAALGLPHSAASSSMGRRLEAGRRGRWGGGGLGDGGGGRGGSWRGGSGGGRRRLGGGKGGGGKRGGGRGGGGKGGGGGAARGNARRSFLLFDQTLINAALLSAVLGKPAWPRQAEDELRPCSSSSFSTSTSTTSTAAAASSTPSGKASSPLEIDCLPQDATQWQNPSPSPNPDPDPNPNPNPNPNPKP